MYPAMIICHIKSNSGKRIDQQLAARRHAGNNLNSRLFHIADRISATRFLVDTGAEVSVVPPNHMEKRLQVPFNLQAVTKTSISTYGS